MDHEERGRLPSSTDAFLDGIEKAFDLSGEAIFNYVPPQRSPIDAIGAGFSAVGRRIERVQRKFASEHSNELTGRRAKKGS